MRIRMIEITVGAFMLAGILALAFLAIRVSGVNLDRSDDVYRVTAVFDDVAGLRERAKVSMSGVTLGRVSRIEIDTEFGEALVTMELNASAGAISNDAGAQILTEGILGARYVGLVPGGSDEPFVDGDVIDSSNTQGALVIEKLVGDLVTRLGAS